MLGGFRKKSHRLALADFVPETPGSPSAQTAAWPGDQLVDQLEQQRAVAVVHEAVELQAALEAQHQRVAWGGAARALDEWVGRGCCLSPLPLSGGRPSSGKHISLGFKNCITSVLNTAFFDKKCAKKTCAGEGKHWLLEPPDHIST